MKAIFKVLMAVGVMAALAACGSTSSTKVDLNSESVSAMAVCSGLNYYQGCTGTNVGVIQQYLVNTRNNSTIASSDLLKSFIKASYLAGAAEIDCSYGAKTKSAALAFQKDYNSYLRYVAARSGTTASTILEDGNVGPQTGPKLIGHWGITSTDRYNFARSGYVCKY